MPVYRYKARDREGRHFGGSHEAPDEGSAVKSLQSRGLLVTDIGEASGRARTTPKMRNRRVKGSDLLIFTQELATLLNSGVVLLRALEIVSRQITSHRLSTALEEVKAGIQAGSTLSAAISKHPRVFPPLWTFVIEAGEVSGNLPLVLTGLARNLETSENLKKKVTSALVYPAVLICMAIGAVAVFVLKVIPVFAKLFESFDAELPLLTRLVIQGSALLSQYLIVILALIAGAVFILRRQLGTPRGHAAFDSLAIRAPIIGNFLRDAAMARIAMNLSILIKSGVDFLSALSISARTAGNAVYENTLMRVRDEVQEGLTLSEAMNKHYLFSSIMIQMIKVGEETGRLDEMVGKIGEYYESRINTFIARLSTLIEPAVLLFVGTIIGVLVIAMFLPIFSLSSLI